MQYNPAIYGIGYALATSVLLGAGQARADVKITTEVSLSGTLPVSIVANAPAKNSDALTEPLRPDVTYTTFYKGNKARRESVGGSLVVIYDKDAGKVYTFSPEAKKYYVLSFKEALDNGSGLPGPVAEVMNVISSVELDDQVSGADVTRSLAGKDATKIGLFGSVTAGPKSANSPGFAPAGGQFSHGGTGTASSGDDPSADAPKTALLGRATLNGNLWLTDYSSILPDGKKGQTEMLIAIVQQELPSGCPVLKSLANEMAKKKAFPLASKIIIRSYEPTVGGVSAADPGASGFSLNPASNSKSITITTEVKSIDANVTLDDALFQLPAGLEKVDPPSPITPLPLHTSESDGDS